MAIFANQQIACRIRHRSVCGQRELVCLLAQLCWESKQRALRLTVHDNVNDAIYLIQSKACDGPCAVSPSIDGHQTSMGGVQAWHWEPPPMVQYALQIPAQLDGELFPFHISSVAQIDASLWQDSCLDHKSGHRRTMAATSRGLDTQRLSSILTIRFGIIATLSTISNIVVVGFCFPGRRRTSRRNDCIQTSMQRVNATDNGPIRHYK